MLNSKKIGLVVILTLCLALFGGILSVGAMAEDAVITVTTDFGKIETLDGASNIVDHKGVSVNADQTHGAIPSNEWGSPFHIADESYIIYEIKATDNGADQVFDTLKLNVNARVWNQNDGTAHNENAINIYIGTSPAAANYLVHSYTPAEQNTGANFDDLAETDLGVAAGYATAYVKVELKQSKASGEGTLADENGDIDIWYAGIKLNTITFTATTKEGTPPEVKDFTLTDDFTAAQITASNVKEAVGVCSDANVHGIVPGANWGADITIADNSYIVYKLTADTDKIFDELTIGVSGRIWNQNDGNCHENNKINVYIGDDGETYEKVLSYGCANTSETEWALNAAADITNYVKGKESVFVKIELVQDTSAGSTLELALLGVKLYSVSFEGNFADIEYVTVNYNDGEETLYEDVRQKKGEALNGYIPAEKEGFEFIGWYTDAEFTTEITSDFVANGNVTVYGKWKETEKEDDSASASDATVSSAPAASSNEKSGCLGAMGVTSVAAFAALGAAALIRKKKEN
ncbi:MAG: InlB B-repeat-containing protein [Clostridia bacterium]|nr:InlB B-repeat-containing protein [Clostridia bacterium]